MRKTKIWGVLSLILFLNTSVMASGPAADTVCQEVNPADFMCASGVNLNQTCTSDADCPSYDSDASLTAAAGVTEPVNLPSTADTVLKAVAVFDFTLSDGGTADGVATTISAIKVTTSGTNISNITWRLNGPGASNVIGQDVTPGDIKFSGLTISIANGTSEVYTINAYYNDPTGLTDNTNISLSIDGDTDVTVGASGTQMGATTPVTGTTKVDVTATKLQFHTEPSNQRQL